MRRSSQEITRLLVAWNRGEESALAELTPLVHGELRRLARSYLRRERGNHTLQTDALVNEAYLRLIDLSRVEWRDRVHFLALSARLMRRPRFPADVEPYPERYEEFHRLLQDNYFQAGAGASYLWRGWDLLRGVPQNGQRDEQP